LIKYPERAPELALRTPLLSSSPLVLEPTTKHLFASLLAQLRRPSTAALMVLAGTALCVASATANTGSALPRAGLVMHLDATQGVPTTGKKVSRWLDQSGYGHDLRTGGSPKLITRGLSGKPVIELAKGSDRLVQPRNSSLPAYGNDRTFVVLSAPTGVRASFGWGKPKGCKQFALQHDPDGYSAVNTGCKTDLMHTEKSLKSGRWRLNVVVMDSGTLYHLQDGELVDSRSRRISTGVGPFGIRTKGPRKTNNHLRVATVLAYDWALGTKELAALHRYIGKRWFNNPRKFASPPNFRKQQLPKPQMQLQQRRVAGQGVEISWRASYADECRADGNWTRLSSTTGKQLIRSPVRASTYSMNCWSPTASSNATVGDYLRSIRLNWEPTRANGKRRRLAHRVYVGTRPGRYDNSILVPASGRNSHTLELAPGEYFLAISTVDAKGRESKLSAELAITVN